MATNAKKIVGGRTTSSSARNNKPRSGSSAKPRPKAKAKARPVKRYRKGAQ